MNTKTSSSPSIFQVSLTTRVYMMLKLTGSISHKSTSGIYKFTKSKKKKWALPLSFTSKLIHRKRRNSVNVLPFKKMYSVFFCTLFFLLVKMSFVCILNETRVSHLSSRRNWMSHEPRSFITVHYQYSNTPSNQQHTSRPANCVDWIWIPQL